MPPQALLQLAQDGRTWERKSRTTLAGEMSIPYLKADVLRTVEMLHSGLPDRLLGQLFETQKSSHKSPRPKERGLASGRSDLLQVTMK